MKVVRGVYQHHKGNQYYVLGVAIKSGTEDDKNPEYVVIYRPLYGACKLTFRSLEEFTGQVEGVFGKVDRFEIVWEEQD